VVTVLLQLRVEIGLIAAAMLISTNNHPTYMASLFSGLR